MCRSAYQQFVHLLRLTVLRSGAELLLSVLSGEITLFFFIGFPSGWSNQSTEAAAYQNGLHVRQCGRRLVHEHFLGDFFTPLCPVQFVVCVAAQGGPAEELG